MFRIYTAKFSLLCAKIFPLSTRLSANYNLNAFFLVLTSNFFVHRNVFGASHESVA